MDFALTPGPNGQLRMSLDAASDMRNNILLSLHVKKGAFFLDPDFGSRLHEVQSLSVADIALAQQYAAESLAWLIKIGRAKTVSISAAREGIYLRLNIVVVRSDNSPASYETYYRVV